MHRRVAVCSSLTRCREGSGPTLPKAGKKIHMHALFTVEVVMPLVL